MSESPSSGRCWYPAFSYHLGLHKNEAGVGRIIVVEVFYPLPGDDEVDGARSPKIDLALSQLLAILCQGDLNVLQRAVLEGHIAHYNSAQSAIAEAASIEFQVDENRIVELDIVEYSDVLHWEVDNCS